MCAVAVAQATPPSALGPQAPVPRFALQAMSYPFITGSPQLPPSASSADVQRSLMPLPCHLPWGKTSTVIALFFACTIVDDLKVAGKPEVVKFVFGEIQKVFGEFRIQWKDFADWCSPSAGPSQQGDHLESDRICARSPEDCPSGAQHRQE